MNLEERQHAVDVLRDTAFSSGTICSACHGRGRVPVADDPLFVRAKYVNFNDAVEEILVADEVRWVPDPSGYELEVTTAGKTQRYDVTQMSVDDLRHYRRMQAFAEVMAAPSIDTNGHV